MFCLSAWLEYGYNYAADSLLTNYDGGIDMAGRASPQALPCKGGQGLYLLFQEESVISEVSHRD